MAMAAAFGQEADDASHFAVAGDFAQAEIADVRERDQNRQAVVDQPEQVKPLIMARKGPAADVLKSRDPMVGVYDLLTNLKRHAWTLLGL